MSSYSAGLTSDPVFVGLTRPPMRWGVTYTALMMNAICSMELFLLTRNLLTLLIALPIHGVCVLLCARDARYFDLLALWARTRLLGLVATYRYWQACSYSPLALDLPNYYGRRRLLLTGVLVHRSRGPDRSGSP